MYIFLVTRKKGTKIFGFHFSAKSSKKSLVTIFSVKNIEKTFWYNHFSVKILKTRSGVKTFEVTFLMQKH